MAYNNVEETLLDNIEVGTRGDEIDIKHVRDKSRNTESIDIRRYYIDDNGELAPTKKGVRVNMELVPDIIKAMAKALDTYELEELSEELKSLADSREEETEETEG